MVTATHIVRKLIGERPFLEEALAKGLVNYSAVAEDLKVEIEKELGKKVTSAAVMMALRREAERLSQSFIPKSLTHIQESDITLQSGLMEWTIARSSTVQSSIQELHKLAGGAEAVMSVVTGVHETTLISNRKNKPHIKRAFTRERTISTLDNLAALTVRIPTSAVDTVGVFYTLTKALNWENINIVEIVSTYTELTLIVREDDAARAFTVLRKLLKKEK